MVLFSGLIFKMVIQFAWSSLTFVFSTILNYIQILGEFMLKPFDFTINQFVAVLSGDFINEVESVFITVGIALSILFLIFGLLRVFTGRLNDDVPNPFTLIGKFIVAVFACYWIIPISNDYIFPFAQQILDKIFQINTVLDQTNYQELLDTWTNANSSQLFPGESTITGLASVASGTMSWIVFLLLFVICLIAALINTFKLIAENAERYFTVNILILSGPLATSCIVSEKTMQVFKNWFAALISNIITIIFNVFGFKILLRAYQNCFLVATNAMAGTNGKGLSDFLIVLVCLVAISKLVQKFDQIISMVVFKINPIQNRSLLMAALATAGSIDKVAGSIAKGTGPFGKMARGAGSALSAPLKGDKAILNKIKGAVGNQKAGGANSKDGVISYDNKLAENGALNSALNGNVSDNLKEKLGVANDNPAALQSNSELDQFGKTRIGAGEMIDAIQKSNIDNGLDKAVTPEQAKQVTDAINANLKDDNHIVGYDPQRKEFITGSSPEGNHKFLDSSPQAVANLMNSQIGEGNITTLDFSGSDASESLDDFKRYQEGGYYYRKIGNKAEIYEDTKGLNIKRRRENTDDYDV